MNSSPKIPWDTLESVIRQDPMGRGVASFRAAGQGLCTGQLESAARSLASGTGAVGIVTGFCVIDAPQPAAETDGPPGALYLARALMALGREVTIITDAFGRPLLEAGCDHWGLPRTLIAECPFDADSLDAPERWSHAPECCRRTDAWIDTLFATGAASRWSHLVAIERPAPSHTRESLAAQTRTEPAPLDEFERDVPADERDVCHNMRGGRITGYTAKTHRLFERIRERQLPITTIGIGDGGNEIGLGCIPWETLRAAIAVGPSALVPSRIATDHLLLAGVSDWGGYALAAATCAVAGRAELLHPWTPASQAELVKALVREAGAVDGVIRRPQATVDGLPLELYLDPLEKIREFCGA